MPPAYLFGLGGGDVRGNLLRELHELQGLETFLILLDTFKALQFVVRQATGACIVHLRARASVTLIVHRCSRGFSSYMLWPQLC